MKKLFFLFFILSSISYSQISDFEDELIDKMCNYLIENKQKDDSIRVFEAYNTYLVPYFENINENKIDSVFNIIYVRFQKKCSEFFWILENENPTETSEAVFYDIEQQSTITNVELEEFKMREKFYYKLNGTITKVIISENGWFEEFEDGTYAKTSMIWNSKNSFTLTFIESNNLEKNAYSRQGESYKYQIIKKENNYYWVQIFETSHGKFTNFKLYLAE